jgi:hypothetical protein
MVNQESNVFGINNSSPHLKLNYMYIGRKRLALEIISEHCKSPSAYYLRIYYFSIEKHPAQSKPKGHVRLIITRNEEVITAQRFL